MNYNGIFDKVVCQLKKRYYNLCVIREHCERHSLSYAKYMLNDRYDHNLYNGPIDVYLYDYVMTKHKQQRNF